MLFGAITSTTHEIHNEKLMDIAENNTILLGNYKAILQSVNSTENKDSVGIKAKFSIWHKNKEIGKSYPEVKFYKIEKMQLPDSASFYHNFSDIYIIVSGVDGEKNMIMVKIYYKKFIGLIWLGCLMIGFGGFLKIIQSRKNAKIKKNSKNSILNDKKSQNLICINILFNIYTKLLL
jgi:cytochrome c-type biogenesis protein CcmF